MGSAFLLPPGNSGLLAIFFLRQYNGKGGDKHE